MDESKLTIRPEEAADQSYIRHVTQDAFGQSEFGYHGEADLIDQLRSATEPLSLVAEIDDQVVGHIVSSPAALRFETEQLSGMGIGPMSVQPSRQRQGIGTSLIEATLARLDTEGCRFTIVLGHPEYYPRFGFLPADSQGVRHGFAGIPQNVFFIRTHPQQDLPNLSSLAFYHEAFGPQHEENQ